MLLCLAAIWGGSFFLAKIALDEVPPLTITLHRTFWALPVLVGVVWYLGIRLPRDPRIWGAYLVMGGLNNAIPFSLIFWGQTYIGSGLAAILNGTTAVFGAVIAGLVFSDEALTRPKIIGALFGLAGVAAVIGPSALHDLDLRDLAQLAILCAALFYAIASVWAKLTLKGIAPQMNALGMVAGSTLLMIPVVLIQDGPPDLALSGGVWAALLSLSVICTSLAYLLYFAILVRAGAANLMLVTLLIPPFAIALGAIFLDERLSLAAIAGFALIGIGILITDGRIFGKRRRPA